MRFPERAVLNCVQAMRKRTVSQRHLKDVLKYEDADVTPIEQFLDSEDSMVRKFAVQIVAERGDVAKVVQLATTEKSRSVLMAAVKGLQRRKVGPEELIDLLNSDDGVLREAVIQMFRRTGNADNLFILLFNKDRQLVSRIKRYIEEHDATQQHPEEPV